MVLSKFRLHQRLSRKSGFQPELLDQVIPIFKQSRRHVVARPNPGTGHGIRAIRVDAAWNYQATHFGNDILSFSRTDRDPGENSNSLLREVKAPNQRQIN